MDVRNIMKPALYILIKHISMSFTHSEKTMKRVSMLINKYGGDSVIETRTNYRFSSKSCFKEGCEIIYLYHPVITIMDRSIYLYDDKEGHPYQAYLYEHYTFGEEDEKS